MVKESREVEAAVRGSNGAWRLRRMLVVAKGG
jgi:hypothetical protein